MSTLSTVPPSLRDDVQERLQRRGNGALVEWGQDDHDFGMDAWEPHHLLWSLRPRSIRGRRVACVGNRPRLHEQGLIAKSAAPGGWWLNDERRKNRPGRNQRFLRLPVSALPVCARSRTAAPALAQDPPVERRLRVVLDHQLGGLRRLPGRPGSSSVPQRHVDAAGNPAAVMIRSGRCSTTRCGV